MPPRKPKALKREYTDDNSDDDFTPGEERDDEEITMKITKKSKASKKIKNASDGDANEGSIKAKNEPMKQGYDIATGVVQDEALHAKYSAMTLDELKQYMKVRPDKAKRIIGRQRRRR